jgi:uncharacterized membrane protein YhaH (DUF805 family)
MQEAVDPAAYATCGFTLMIFKYAVEATAIWLILGSVYLPWHFINPMFSSRFEMAQNSPPWLGWVWFIWTLPFLWVAISMSVRRTADASWSPWMGFLVLVPIVNLTFMVGMCFVPSRDGEYWKRRSDELGRASAKDAAMAVGVSLIFGGCLLFITVYALSSYGESLYVGTPTMMGALAAYLYNRTIPRTYLSSVGIGVSSVSFAGVALLLFALEGAICISMALPIFLPLGAFGAFVGKAIADASRRPHIELLGCVIAVPLWAAMESFWQPHSEYVVTTTVVVNAPPEVVWRNVIQFPELPPDIDWLFRLGIASPRRARIIGHGVGAIRYCEFTTGEFVEPITVWSPPHRLAFDVIRQPDPMVELSPFGHIHPPHLDGYMKSNRGEFALIAIEGGRTRLEGRTWYEIRMFPQWYWALWCDSIVHRIHQKVLRHIQQQAEVEVQKNVALQG